MPGAANDGSAIERAHLRDPRDDTFTIDRYPPEPELAELVRRFWIPVWNCPPEQPSTQQVLQYPICLAVVSNSYARFYGVMSGLSTTVLEGRGWAVGVMFQPAAGYLISGGSVARLTDRFIDLTQVPHLDGPGLTGSIRQVMAPNPSDSAAHRAAARLMSEQLQSYLPIDAEGRMINELVASVEESPQLRLVGQLCAQFGLTERSLQRLTQRRLGLSPKWLILRRRLHEAADRLRAEEVDLAGIAAELGYADQTHLTRDFRRVTGWTPGAFAARYR